MRLRDPGQELLRFIAVALAFSPVSLHADDVYERTIRGATCQQNTAGHMYCKYLVGNDLEFSITAAGEPDMTIAVLRSDWNGDYFVRIGGDSGCIIVVQGKVLTDKEPADFALISPKNGKVYRTPQECSAAR